jgi:hypothetical protein
MTKVLLTALFVSVAVGLGRDQRVFLLIPKKG